MLIKVNEMAQQAHRPYICCMKRTGKAYLPMLMAVTLIVITGFQLFWLSQIFRREKDNLNRRSYAEFSDAVLKLQAQKFRAKFGGWQSKDSSVNITLTRNLDSVLPFEKAETVVGIVGAMKTEDSIHLKRVPMRTEQLEMQINQSPRIIIRNGKGGMTEQFAGPDSLLKDGNVLVTMLQGIEALSDSIDTGELRKEVAANFAAAGLNVPFRIYKDSSHNKETKRLKVMADAPGWRQRSVFELELGNAFGYYMKRMAQPILFSLFLLGVTLTSFLLLYRSLRQQQRLAVLKNDLISNITHELKTPIATVNVALEALQNFNAINDPVKTAEYLDISKQELKRLQLLVDKVLRVSMFENSMVELKREEVDLVALINSVTDSMRLQIERAGAAVSLNVQGSDHRLMADRHHMMSVVYNLLDNALKYSKSVPKIDITVREMPEQLELRFADNGIGVPAAFQDKVFDKFFRVPTGDVHDVKGYGLGLSYVAHIVKLHGGNIRLQSAEGAGSVFIIQLPRRHG